MSRRTAPPPYRRGGDTTPPEPSAGERHPGVAQPPAPSGDRPAPGARVALLPPRTGAMRSLAGRWAAGLDPTTRHGVVRVVVLLCLTPLTVILADRSSALADGAGPAAVYGTAVLAATAAMFYVAYTRYRDPAVTQVPCPRRLRGTFPPLPERPRVSLLLAVKDEETRIEECVRSMAGSDHPGVQIVVVDDASCDGTGDILRRLGAELGITVVHLAENVGKKHALVQACARADGDVIVFTDSDCVLAPDAVGRCVTALVRHPHLGAVSGHCRALNPDASLLARIQDVWYEGQFRVAKAAEAAFGSVTCVSGPLAAFRRDAIWNYLPAWAEDRFLGAPFRFATDRQLTGYVLGQAWRGKRLKERHAGSPFVDGHDYPERPWLVGYVASARVGTDVPAGVRAFLRQQVRWKKSFIRNLCFTGGFMWRRGPGAAALYYGHVLWVLIAPLMAVRHLVWAPVQGLWLLTGLYLCGVLLKGCAWGMAYKADHPGDTRWRYRPLMSLLSSTVLAWLLPYSLATVRRGVWSRGTS
ncbi:glycosyltransferase family 2 protein [Streptomyces sp. t39]|uniref:glycosyltransferase family 2 protein n=1 Tax=Streptomyces sp. t39 TaxID=1828156 RepID=UPI0039676D4B